MLVRLADDPTLRSSLVEQGFARARRTTVEAYVDAMADEIDRLLAARPGSTAP